MNHQGRILVVGEDAGLDDLAARVAAFGHEVCATESSATPALAAATASEPDLALIDLAVDGIAEAARALSVDLGASVVFLVSDADDALLRRAQAADPLGYVVKPAEETQLRLALFSALATRRRLAKPRSQTRFPEKELLETIFQSVNEGVSVMDTQFVIRFANAAAARMVGMEKVEQADNRLRRFRFMRPDKITPLSWDEVPLVRALQFGETCKNFETYVIPPTDSGGFFASIDAKPLYDDEGHRTGCLTVTRDISEQKAGESQLRSAAAELRRQRDRTNLILDSIGDGVVVCDHAGRVDLLNPAGRDLFGWPKGEDAAPPTRSEIERMLFEPEQAKRLPKDQLPLAKALRNVPTDHVEMCRQRPQREDVYIDVSARPILSESGEVEGAVAALRDITPVKKREIELREVARRLSERTETLNTVFDGIADGIALLDTDGKVVRINPGAGEIITPELVDDLSRTPPGAGMDVFHPDRVTPFRFKDLPHVRALRGEPRHNVRLFIVHPSMPEGKMLSISARAIHAGSEEPSHIVVLFRDVTVEHQQEQALLHAFTQGRLDVIDTVLHNVGNAINSVATGVGTLRERMQSRKLLHRLSAVAAALRTHEDDWFDYLRNDPQGSQVLPFVTALDRDMQQENTELEGTLDRVTERVQHIVEILRTQQSFDVDSPSRKIVSFRKTLWSSVHILEESLHSSGIAVRVECKTAPKEVLIHESRFQQMLVNLVRNAIDAINSRAVANGADFRPAVRIDGYVEDDHLMVDVTDNGVGIDSALLDQVFAPGFTTKKGGNGLGLHSAANYVIDSGGRIEAISDGPGQGATIRSGWPLQTMLPE